MASTMVAVGLTLAAAGFAGRYAMQAMKHMEPQVKLALEASKSAFGSGYYRGGFEPKMTRREASLILGISPTANKNKIREAHRKLMILNHPDRVSILQLTEAVLAEGGVVGLAHAVHDCGVFISAATTGASATIGVHLGVTGIRVRRLIRLSVVQQTVWVYIWIFQD
uniref:Mitochondrial import inner membrane translocase subunit TIM14 n=1 Tax=Cyprinus carpio carpio TaxID=630221 RepID=A0A9J8BHH9_CYPCA